MCRGLVHPLQGTCFFQGPLPWVQAEGTAKLVPILSCELGFVFTRMHTCRHSPAHPCSIHCSLVFLARQLPAPSLFIMLWGLGRFYH